MKTKNILRSKIVLRPKIFWRPKTLWILNIFLGTQNIFTLGELEFMIFLKNIWKEELRQI